MCPTCFPSVCADTHRAAGGIVPTFPVCAHRVAAVPDLAFLFPRAPVTLSAMAKKSKKAPEEEAPKKGKKKSAAKK